MSLSSLLRRGVGLQLEVMSELSADRLAETLVAFANGDGGTVLLGSDAQGKSRTICRPRMPKTCCARALAQCRPLVRTEWERFEGRAGWWWASMCRAAPSCIR